MAAFHCQVCGEEFSVPGASLKKYPGWKPKYCRAHSPKKGKRAGRRAPVTEENLTLQEVLDKYDGGPQSGLFTDGSAIPNPGPGGWGVVWVEDGVVREERHGHDPDTTNNRMELVALIEAYKLLPPGADVVVRTDSRLCVDTMTKWAPGWERKGWKRKGGTIANLELVQELLDLVRARPRASLQWIEAHAGNLWNEYADSLATAWNRDSL